ncbi:hypothetical protein V6N13_147106 [Hibiscus sabdariffa]
MSAQRLLNARAVTILFFGANIAEDELIPGIYRNCQVMYGFLLRLWVKTNYPQPFTGSGQPEKYRKCELQVIVPTWRRSGLWSESIRSKRWTIGFAKLAFGQYGHKLKFEP